MKELRLWQLGWLILDSGRGLETVERAYMWLKLSSEEVGFELDSLKELRAQMTEKELARGQDLFRRCLAADFRGC